MPILDVDIFYFCGITLILKLVSLFVNKYIFMAVDYFTKWVEGVSLLNNEGKSVFQFPKSYVFSR